MNQTEQTELIQKSKFDGALLYKASEWLYKILLGFMAVFALIGIVASVALAEQSGAVGLIVGLLATSVVVFMMYVFAVLSTHISKVLVHILFSNVAILEKDKS